MNQDFAEMLAALSDAGADYLVVGAHALAAHGIPRATGALDIWVRPTPDDAERVWTALERFGVPLHELQPQDRHSPEVAAGRPRDLADVAELEEARGASESD